MQYKAQNYDISGNTPLHHAVNAGDVNAVISCIKAGDKVGVTNHHGITPIMIAHGKQASNYKQIVQILFKVWFQEIQADKDFVINKQDVWLQTPTFWAVRYGFVEMVEYLIKKGANPLIANNQGLNAMDYAADRRGTHEAFNKIHDMLFKAAFPWIRDDMPEQIKTLFSGYKWEAPANDETLVIPYTMDKGSFQKEEIIAKRVAIVQGNKLEGKALNENQRIAIKSVLSHYEDIINVRFVEVAPEQAKLFIRQSDLSARKGIVPARTDRYMDNNGNIKQVCLSLDPKIMENPLIESRQFVMDGEIKTHYNEFRKVLVHEMGHVMGLEHPKTGCNITETIMSYNHEGLENGEYPEFLRANDIEALTAMYGTAKIEEKPLVA